MSRFRYPIGFIGAGHIGSPLIRSLIKKKLFRPREIAVATAHATTRRTLAARDRITALRSNRDLAAQCRCVVLAVRPQQMSAVLREIRSVITRDHLIITLAAGLDLAFYQRSLKKTKLIRAMPNRALLVGRGVTALFATRGVSRSERRFTQQIFSCSGTAFFADHESWFDPITAVAACGIAFVLLFLSALIRGGVRNGLPPSLARLLVFKTASGALKLLEEPSARLEEEIQKVASKGGTTEAGLTVFREKKFAEIVEKAIRKATERSTRLRKEFQ